jgi:predicted CoA-binding protein
MEADRYDQLVREFLGKKRIAIWGMEDAKSDPGHFVAGKLRKQGVEIIAVNPRFSDDPSQRRASSLTKIEPPVEAVLVYVDRPQTMEAVDDCVPAKIPMVRLHDALSSGAAILVQAIAHCSRRSFAMLRISFVFSSCGRSFLGSAGFLGQPPSKLTAPR